MLQHKRLLEQSIECANRWNGARVGTSVRTARTAHANTNKLLASANRHDGARTLTSSACEPLERRTASESSSQTSSLPALLERCRRTVANRWNGATQGPVSCVHCWNGVHAQGYCWNGTPYACTAGTVHAVWRVLLERCVAWTNVSVCTAGTVSHGDAAGTASLGRSPSWRPPYRVNHWNGTQSWSKTSRPSGRTGGQVQSSPPIPVSIRNNTIQETKTPKLASSTQR